MAVQELERKEAMPPKLQQSREPSAPSLTEEQEELSSKLSSDSERSIYRLVHGDSESDDDIAVLEEEENQAEDLDSSSYAADCDAATHSRDKSGRTGKQQQKRQQTSTDPLRQAKTPSEPHTTSSRQPVGVRRTSLQIMPTSAIDASAYTDSPWLMKPRDRQPQRNRTVVVEAPPTSAIHASAYDEGIAWRRRCQTNEIAMAEKEQPTSIGGDDTPRRCQSSYPAKSGADFKLSPPAPRHYFPVRVQLNRGRRRPGRWCTPAAGQDNIHGQQLCSTQRTSSQNRHQQQLQHCVTKKDRHPTQNRSQLLELQAEATQHKLASLYPSCPAAPTSCDTSVLSGRTSNTSICSTTTTSDLTTGSITGSSLDNRHYAKFSSFTPTASTSSSLHSDGGRRTIGASTSITVTVTACAAAIRALQTQAEFVQTQLIVPARTLLRKKQRIARRRHRRERQANIILLRVVGVHPLSSSAANATHVSAGENDCTVRVELRPVFQ